MVSSIPNEKEEVDSPLNFHLLPTLGTCVCLSIFKNIAFRNTFFRQLVLKFQFQRFIRNEIKDL